MIRQAGSENLGLIFEAAKRTGVNYAVAITPEFIAVGIELGIAAAPRLLHRISQVRQGSQSKLLASER